jgi:hypothetical protein
MSVLAINSSSSTTYKRQVPCTTSTTASATPAESVAEVGEALEAAARDVEITHG